MSDDPKLDENTILPEQQAVHTQEDQTIPNQQVQELQQQPEEQEDQPKQQLQQNQSLNLQMSIVPQAQQAQAEQTAAEEPPKADDSKKIDDNFFYPFDHVETAEEETPIPQSITQFYQQFGYDSLKRYNIHLIDDSNVIYISGVTYHILNIKTGERQVYFTRDGGGIGGLAVHPSKKCFAVAEKGINPNIYVYTYPDLRLYRILRLGTERSYSSVVFSANGERIASVGSAPDFQICVWDWKQELILLKAKAFSQEVYRVTFSKYNENILSTSGMGHIKFWKVAETFTGLKLKGEVGKFGSVELSDIYAYYEFPDGKVLSGTEYERMLLWEGNTIKCVVSINQDTPCHQGVIESVILENDQIVTAGEDGTIKFWNFATIDNAESDDFLNFFIQPTRVVEIAADDIPAHIFQIERNLQFWLIQDSKGRLFKLSQPDMQECTLILATNAGKIRDLIISPNTNAAVTVGDDGAVRVWDYANKQEFASRTFPGKATCAAWIPFNRRNQSRVVCVGFSTGIVRFLAINQNQLVLIKAVKVHKKEIQQIAISLDTQYIAVIDVAGDIFFLLNKNGVDKYEPWIYIESKQQINSAVFNKKNDRLLLGCKDGYIHEMKIPNANDVDNTQSYEVPFDSRKILVKMMDFQKPKKEEMELELLLRRGKGGGDDKIFDVEWDPQQILTCIYYGEQENRVLCCVDGKFLGFWYVVDWNKERPVDAIQAPKIPTQYMGYANDNDLLMVGFKDGSFQLRHRFDFKNYIQVRPHDRDYGKVRKVHINHENTIVMTVGEDGTFASYQIDYHQLEHAAKGGFVEKNQIVFQNVESGLTESYFQEALGIEEDEDIINDKIYSIQEAKLLAEEDNKKNEAEKKKAKVRQEIAHLRHMFEEIKVKNQQEDETARLTKTELCVDPEYEEQMLKNVEEDLFETKKELEWDSYFVKLQTDRIKSYVQDELEVDKFAVIACKNSKNLVTTFKVKKLSPYVQKELEVIYKLIEEEKQNQLKREQQEQSKQQNQTQNLNQTTNVNATTAQNNQTTQINQQQQNPGEQTQHKTGGIKAEKERQKQEEEKIRREMEELEKTKPTKESLQPDHLRDIQEAIETLGDYKLKCSKDYVVPENQRMNVSKKRKHMFLLEEFIYNTKIKFNQELIQLKAKKKEIITKIKDYNSKITEINQQLGKTEDLFTPLINQELEDPLYYLNVQEDQIEEYIKSKQKKDKNIKETVESSINPKDPPQNSIQKGSYKNPEVKGRKGMKVQTSELEDEAKIITEMILTAEKKRMQTEIEEDIALFDTQVLRCMNEKSVLESDMKIAQMKLITFHQELLVLEDMEEHDNKLITDLVECKKEKMNLEDQSNKIIDNLAQLAKKDQMNEKELSEQMKAFKELVYPDDDSKREKIHQYYLKKFKKDKAKKLKVQQKDEDADEDDEEGEQSSEEEDAMDDEDDEKPDISPVENDVKIREIIDKICELEDMQETNRKEKMDNERQKGQIANKIINLMKDLKKAEEELRNYQRKKLQRVNQLDVSYILRLSQIQNLIAQADTYRLPTDLNNSILFTEGEFYRLCKRIRELEMEQKKIEKQKKQLEKKKKVFEKESLIKDAKTSDLNNKYKEKHMLKFGDIIDLKILDALEPTKQVLEMREQFKKEEKLAVIRVEEAKKKLQEIKKKLLDSKKENTKIINNITKLGKQQMDLSKKLDSTNKNLFKEENEDRRNDLDRERQNLKDLVQFLSKEIEDLKTEIGLFKRKGGHIYTMVTSTKKQPQ